MDTNKLKKNLHSANTYLAVMYGYLQLLESKLAKATESEKELDWVKKSLSASENLKNLIMELEEEIKKD